MLFAICIDGEETSSPQNPNLVTGTWSPEHYSFNQIFTSHVQTSLRLPCAVNLSPPEFSSTRGWTTSAGNAVLSFNLLVKATNISYKPRSVFLMKTHCKTAPLPVGAPTLFMTSLSTSFLASGLISFRFPPPLTFLTVSMHTHSVYPYEEKNHTHLVVTWVGSGGF